MELVIGNNTAWYVVKFLDENMVEAVPVSWFKDLNHCYWPPYKDTAVAEAIRLNEVPSKSWKLYNCKILSKSKIVDYPTAMKKACRAQYESELSEAESATNNSTKRIKKRNTKYDDTMSDEEYSTPNKRTKLIPFPPTFDDFINSNNSANEPNYEEDILHVPENVTTNDFLMSPTAITDVLNNNPMGTIDTMDDLQKYIDTKFEDLRHEQIKLHTIVEKWQSDTSRLLITMGIHQKEQLKYLENIQYIVNNTANATTISNVGQNNKDKKKEEEIIYTQFPITSLEDLNKLDNEVKQLKLSKVDVYDALVKNLSLIGGSTCSELLRRVLKKILSDEVAAKYSWFGRQKKLSFAATSLGDLVKSAVKIKYKDETDKNLEIVAGTWLAKAKERLKTPGTANSGTPGTANPGTQGTANPGTPGTTNNNL